MAAYLAENDTTNGLRNYTTPRDAYRAIESRWVVGFRVVLDAYRAAEMAVLGPVLLSGCRSAMEVSDR